MRRTYLFIGLIGACSVASLVVWRAGLGRSHAALPGQPPAASATLPLTQVVLFNNGIGYFQREGEVDGTTRVDLNFPATDVNDLIKSLVLQDTTKGAISAISYDGQEPVERALRSFSLDLTYNPTFGQLLNQARGEKVEVTRLEGGATSSLTGTIVGMESEAGPNNREEHSLNVLSAEGLRRVPLVQVQRVRFLNPTLDTEFRRALEVLAGSHNSQRRTVSLHVKGEGKRNVKLGYVVENPIWKATYRLVFDKKGQPTLQGWAVVENTSDEDWKDVRMALVSGRPFSFQMNLYPPVFVPRPTIEPEMLASLRPPIYQGSEDEEKPARPGARRPQVGLQIGGLQVGGLQVGGFNFGGGGFNFGGSPSLAGMGLLDPHTSVLGGFVGFNRYQTGPGSPGFSTRAATSSRLSYEELIERRKHAIEKRSEARETAREMGKSIAEGLTSLPVEDESGDTYRYALDQRVSLPRQKSALLPVVHDRVEVTKVSIYNQPIHAKFPLLGMKLKNTTKQPLMQGPLAVFEGGSFAGDVRMPDLKPDEERLMSYALDLGLEMRPSPTEERSELRNVLIHNGWLRRTYHDRAVKSYTVRNRSKEDRLLVVSHSIRRGWTVTGKVQPAKRSRDLYRFEWKVPAGTTQRFDVVEERPRAEGTWVSSLSQSSLRSLSQETAASAPLRAALLKVLEHRQRVAETTLAIVALRGKLLEISNEQTRVRGNISTVPAGSAPHKRYVEKFDQLETAWEKGQQDLRDKEALERRLAKALEDHLAQLSVR